MRTAAVAATTCQEDLEGWDGLIPFPHQKFSDPFRCRPLSDADPISDADCHLQTDPLSHADADPYLPRQTSLHYTDIPLIRQTDVSDYNITLPCGR